MPVFGLVGELTSPPRVWGCGQAGPAGECMSSVEVMAEVAEGPPGLETFLSCDQSVLEGMPGAVYVCAADGTILRFNQRAASIWGRIPAPGDPDSRFCGAFAVYD